MRSNPERLAWFILLTSFAIFCLLAITIPLSIRWYIINATVAQKATLEVISGTVLVEERETGLPVGVTTSREVAEGATIKTDTSSRALVTLFDNTTLSIFPATQVTLLKMRTPRFALSPRPNLLVLNDKGGRIRIGAAPPLKIPLYLEVHSPHATTQLEEGSYSIEVTNVRTDIAVRDGQAQVTAAGRTVVLKQGQRTIVEIEKAPADPLPAARNLIVNGNFKEPLSQGWQIFEDQGGDGGEIGGQTGIVSTGDREAVMFTREGAGGNSFRIGATQQIDEDVSDYVSLKLYADVRLIYQSLAGGGFQSSEYPVILRLNYADVNGSQTHWYHGFYYQNQTNNPTMNGEYIPRNIWIPYESPNLLETLNPRPFKIMSLEIYASGWDFESMVSEVRLIGE